LQPSSPLQKQVRQLFIPLHSLKLNDQRTLCEGNLITFAQWMHAWNHFTRAPHFAQPGHWLGPVTRAGLAGSSPAPMGWAGPSPKKYKK
jgi:hypothetical protein